jgi:hypothetical protein
MTTQRQFTMEQKAEAVCGLIFFIIMCALLGVMVGPWLWAYMVLNPGIVAFVCFVLSILWVAVCYEIDARKKRAEFMWHINNLHRRIDEMVPAYMIPPSEGGNDEGSAARV